LLTPAGVVEPLVEYCFHHHEDRSQPWMKEVISSVRLFLQYVQANPDEHDPCGLFVNFAQRLYGGTFDLRTKLDPSGLYWAARSPQSARKIIVHLSDFFAWLGEKRPAAAQMNPRYAGDSFDRQIREAAYQYRRNAAFLGHTWEKKGRPEKISGYYVAPQREPKVAKTDPPAFPEDRFEELLLEGFCPNGRPDYRGMLITLLLHGAGFRESEPFHLYIQDVFPNPLDRQQAGVVIHHPSKGTEPHDWEDARGNELKRTREAYLAQEYGLLPRTKMAGQRHAGWKGGLHDKAYYKVAWWFLPKWGGWFLKYWSLYLDQIVYVERDHPFAFINLSREPVGAMYTLAQYNKAHAAACERIGLTVSKALGTTSHGHRHAYGQRLKRAGIERKVKQRCLHHASETSQDVYTGAYSNEIVEELEAAALRLNEKYSGTQPHLNE
jgi:integrase